MAGFVSGSNLASGESDTAATGVVSIGAVAGTVPFGVTADDWYNAGVVRADSGGVIEVEAEFSSAEIFPGSEDYSAVVIGGAGVDIPEWGTGATLLPGVVTNQIIHGTVLGEPATFRWTGTQWVINPPSATAQAHTAANPMPPGAWSAPSIPGPWYSRQTGLEISFATINSPGNIWFNNDGGDRTFMWQAANRTGRSVDRVRLILPNAVAQSSSARVSVGVGGSGRNAGTYTTPTSPLTIMASGAQGQTQVGLTVVEVDLPSAVAPGARIVIRIEGLAGVPWTGSSSVGIMANPTDIVDGPDMAEDGIGIVDGWSTSNIGVGMQLAGLQWRVTTGNPIVRVVLYSDSRGAGVPPLADPSANLRESWIHHLNVAEAANGQRYCVSSQANGGYDFDMFCDRLEYLISTAPSVLQTLWDVILVDLGTWNGTANSVSLAGDMQARFLAIKASLEPLNIGCLPLLITPPGYDRQTLGHHQAFDSHVAFVAAQGGINIAPTIADPGNMYEMDITRAADDVHIDTAAAPGMGSACAPIFATALSNMGYF